MSRNLGAASPFGVTLKSKSVARMNEKFQAPFGVNLRKFQTNRASDGVHRNLKLKDHTNNRSAETEQNGSGD